MGLQKRRGVRKPLCAPRTDLRRGGLETRLTNLQGGFRSALSAVVIRFQPPKPPFYQRGIPGSSYLRDTLRLPAGLRPCTLLGFRVSAFRLPRSPRESLSPIRWTEHKRLVPEHRRNRIREIPRDFIVTIRPGRERSLRPYRCPARHSGDFPYVHSLVKRDTSRKGGVHNEGSEEEPRPLPARSPRRRPRRPEREERN